MQTLSHNNVYGHTVILRRERILTNQDIVQELLKEVELIKAMLMVAPDSREVIMELLEMRLSDLEEMKNKI